LIVRVEILVPQIGEAVAELTLTNWLKQVGDTVKKGDVLFEIDSDKAIVEVEAFVDGTLAEVLTPAGSAVMPQDVVAYIETVAEDAPDKQTPQDHAPVTLQKVENGRKATPVAQRIASNLGVDLDNVTGSGPGGRITAEDVQRFAENVAGVQSQASIATPARVNASPKAKQLARELNVDLTLLSGTGAGGMIRVKDVEAGTRPASHPPTIISPAKSANLQPLSKLRQTIAERTRQSKQEIPHFYLMVDVDMSRVNELRVHCRDKPGWERPPTYTDILVRACSLALVEFPAANRSYSESGLVTREDVNIGVAVSTDDGLVVPVIPAADRLNLLEVSQELRDVTSRARDGRLKPSDLGLKSMVVSNLGMFSVDRFIAIIDMPDPMILAVGRVAERAVPLNGQVVIRSMCTLSLSVDHRAMDGVLGARFLERVKDHLENPYEIMG
jgi:pyruvate dehydrogenase E2 component (dihydrolipoamide acetyltransferase)